MVDFLGIVRRTKEMDWIPGIEYEANVAMAEHQLNVIAEEAAARFRLVAKACRIVSALCKSRSLRFFYG